jgi:hypothetical protein
LVSKSARVRDPYSSAEMVQTFENGDVGITEGVILQKIIKRRVHGGENLFAEGFTNGVVVGSEILELLVVLVSCGG